MLRALAALEPERRAQITRALGLLVRTAMPDVNLPRMPEFELPQIPDLAELLPEKTGAKTDEERAEG